MAKRAWISKLRDHRDERELFASEINSFAVNLLSRAKEQTRRRLLAERESRADTHKLEEEEVETGVVEEDVLRQAAAQAAPAQTG